MEVEGKRQKRKVERLSATMMRSPTERPQIEIGEGRGTKLGDIPYGNDTHRFKTCALYYTLYLL